MQNSQLTEHEQDQKEIQDSLIIPNRGNLARCESCYVSCRWCIRPDQQRLPKLAGKIATRLIMMTLLTIGLFSCHSDPISVSKTDNPDIRLSKLFTVDGCNVYRFTDGGEHIYLTTCKGKAEYEYETGGKSSIKHRVTSLTAE